MHVKAIILAALTAAASASQAEPRAVPIAATKIASIFEPYITNSAEHSSLTAHPTQWISDAISSLKASETPSWFSDLPSSLQKLAGPPTGTYSDHTPAPTAKTTTTDGGAVRPAATAGLGVAAGALGVAGLLVL